MSDDTLEGKTPEQLRKELGALLRAHRHRKNWSWGELSKRSGLSVDLIVKIEEDGILRLEDFLRWKTALELDPLPGNGTAERAAENRGRAAAIEALDALYQAEIATRANDFHQRQWRETQDRIRSLSDHFGRE